ncbi:hypothetical protein [Peribacillus sp. SCS-155]|uniref:hypothetical protein n=1 Tax=Peribacillus sedimenti TaxID=3115297 RepID=UPI0039066B39
MSMRDYVSVKDSYVVRISGKFFLVIELQIMLHEKKQVKVFFHEISSQEAEILKHMGV